MSTWVRMAVLVIAGFLTVTSAGCGCYVAAGNYQPKEPEPAATTTPVVEVK